MKRHALALSIAIVMWVGPASSDLDVVKAFPTLSISARTGEKPQSKLWQHADAWWGCFSDVDGTHIWRLGPDRWERHATIARSTRARADIDARNGFVTILLFDGEQSALVRYVWWDQGNHYVRLGDTIPVPLDPAAETATTARDGDGVTWIASDAADRVLAHWLLPGAADVEGPVTLADDIAADDICGITALGDGSVGVLWSNQKTKRFGFRRHVPASEPEQWFPDEAPAASSSIAHGDGMADDHLNCALGPDGTLYVAVKTGYDTEGMPLVAALIRRPHGRWDALYNVDDEGSRGIALYDADRARLHVVYTSYRDSQIVVRSSRTDSVAFGPRRTLIEARRINNVSGPRHPVSGPFPLVASQGDTVMHTVVVQTR